MHATNPHHQLVQGNFDWCLNYLNILPPTIKLHDLLASNIGRVELHQHHYHEQQYEAGNIIGLQKINHWYKVHYLLKALSVIFHSENSR